MAARQGSSPQTSRGQSEPDQTTVGDPSTVAYRCLNLRRWKFISDGHTFDALFMAADDRISDR